MRLLWRHRTDVIRICGGRNDREHCSVLRG